MEDEAATSSFIVPRSSFQILAEMTGFEPVIGF
jgi:hypothetical protein